MRCLSGTEDEQVGNEAVQVVTEALPVDGLHSDVPEVLGSSPLLTLGDGVGGRVLTQEALFE